MIARAHLRASDAQGRACRGARSERTEGMTLIEIMIVTLLIALAAAAISFGLGKVTRAEMRASSMRIVAASRYAFSRAVTHGNTVRLLFDLDAHTMTFEEAPGFVTLASSGDPRRDDESSTDAAAVDPWAAAQERLTNTFEPTLGASPFHPIEDVDGDPLERYATQPLGDGILIVKLLVPHEPEPRLSGRGAIYFFPGGMTEQAVVQISDGDERVYSVEIDELTGRGEVFSEAHETELLDEDASDEDRSDVRDPG